MYSKVHSISSTLGLRCMPFLTSVDGAAVIEESAVLCLRLLGCSMQKCEGTVLEG